MHYGEWSLWEMHVFWWMFWIVVIVGFVFSITPVPCSRRRETPLELLQRRYAAGDISAEEYEKREAMQSWCTYRYTTFSSGAGMMASHSRMKPR